MAVGLGFYQVGVYAAALVLSIVFLIGIFEQKVPRKNQPEDDERI